MGLAHVNIPVVMIEFAGKKKTRVRKGKDGEGRRRDVASMAGISTAPGISCLGPVFS